MYAIQIACCLSVANPLTHVAAHLYFAAINLDVIVDKLDVNDVIDVNLDV